MSSAFSDRMESVHKSFIREILKVTENPEVISFAGGLPNPDLFPVREIAEAARKVLTRDGKDALQYSTTEGYRALREYVADTYRRELGLAVDADEILITNGSQQGLDLIGKVFLNKGDRVVIERPGYLGAIQAFSMFQPVFSAVPLLEDGPDTCQLEKILKKSAAKLFYAVPNFQNPSGISYSGAKRREVAGLLKARKVVLVEDDPYRELRFSGESLPSMRKYTPRSILLGSFSKIVAPGLRLGWICADKETMERLVIAKQASDLHSNYFAQRIVYQYLCDGDVARHIEKIRKVYGRQRDAMVAAIEKHFPKEIRHTRPDGGMFLWVTLPERLSSIALLELAMKMKVAFVPGKAFYVDGGGENTLRLNFSNSDEARIEEGIKRLGKAVKRLLARG